jgi:osmotically-inducible protein OsmY
VRKLLVDPLLRPKLGARSQPADAELLAAVESAIDNDPRIANSEVTTAVADSSIKLSGRVDSPSAHYAVQQAAAGVFGAKQVVNATQVRPPQRIMDSELLRCARRRLQAHSDVDASDLEIKVHQRAASVRGPVKNEFERAQTIAAISSISGLVSVSDQLRVLTPQPGRATDQLLEREISDRLASDPSLTIESLGVSVSEGVVSLRGKVLDLETHDRVLQAASRAGARRIVNELVLEREDKVERRARSK